MVVENLNPNNINFHFHGLWKLKLISNLYRDLPLLSAATELLILYIIDIHFYFECKLNYYLWIRSIYTYHNVINSTLTSLEWLQLCSSARKQLRLFFELHPVVICLPPPLSFIQISYGFNNLSTFRIKK